jgi:hypothetical protein
MVGFMKKETVISYFKSGVNTAKVLNISKASVSGWGEIIPEKQALKLEKITNGELKYEPSLYIDAA